MASITGINTSGHYFASINKLLYLFIYPGIYFELKKNERSDIIVLYIVLKIQQHSDTVF